MVKHVVMFQLKPEMAQADKMKVAQQFKESIEALPHAIPSILHIEVGININPDEQWDIVLYSEFNSLEDVKAYAVHPAHLACAALLKEAKHARSCVDYEC